MAICDVGEKVYGTIPNKFNIAKNMNNVKMKGKYWKPFDPMLSFTTFNIFSYASSIIDCHRPGTKGPSSTFNM
jgi:hypothetical protein